MDKKQSRRNFLKASSLFALVGASVPSAVFAHTHTTNTPQNYRARIFFNNSAQLDILSEAAERIFPEDDLGPGAKKLGVGFFIDNELAGNYGNGAKDYRFGPFIAGKKNQGYQYPLTRAELFKMGINALEEEAKLRYKKGFLELNNKQKDEILKAFEADKTKVSFGDKVKASDFFAELRSMTLAGVYADPIYGGNANMQAWKMKNFPGAQMSYSAQVLNGDKFEVIEPISLAEMSH
ncbi:gluconate 2-dehydrogenase subunit 3 family protein [Campylobacter sp. VTCC 70190]|uniref:gluconate 2-dehydrogenase subunit 3 family protein n=1 Tax=Campylobacter sp. VTCC 70190 TaxID=3392118 RepID=UPI00398EEE6E